MPRRLRARCEANQRQALVHEAWRLTCPVVLVGEAGWHTKLLLARSRGTVQGQRRWPPRGPRPGQRCGRAATAPRSVAGSICGADAERRRRERRRQRRRGFTHRRCPCRWRLVGGGSRRLLRLRERRGGASSPDGEQCERGRGERHAARHPQCRPPCRVLPHEPAGPLRSRRDANQRPRLIYASWRLHVPVDLP